MSVINIKNLEFSWPEQSTPILNIQSLEVEKGETFFIQGESGSGKSTFLNILSGIITAKNCEVKLIDTDLTQISNDKKDQFRANHIGYIFQQFNLIGYLTVLENVMLVGQASKLRAKKAIEAHGSVEASAKYWLNKLNITEELMQKKSMMLSVGQQQRVAAARALIGQPDIIIADEPTSSLDQANVQNFIETLITQCEEIQATLIFVSHDLTLKKYFQKHLVLKVNLESSVKLESGENLKDTQEGAQ